MIRFKFAADKAYAALHEMVSNHPGIDLHAALKTCYFADKTHLNEHLRPIFGATYRAMRFGPVPLEIYEMAKAESLWLAELGVESVPWTLAGYRLRPSGASQVDTSALSRSNREHLRAGLERSLSMSFDERTAATHGPDWQAAELGYMRYEDMLDDRPDKDEVIEMLREKARFMRL
ncbi:type II toxin-antitoxin system antitoxin SocA domain-containing protein [Salinarimonas sp. NSM]|uniref:type II toxin-antitoxin system antitoxin SocA domain-containing protein n=1 Tax=Salinarimonas sp. NSM TaxID=3458003 RepID=UPI004035D9F2